MPKSGSSKVLIGEPDPACVDIGLALRQGKDVCVFVWSGSSVLNPGVKTETREIIQRVLSPVSMNEIGTIRCIGLNVRIAFGSCNTD